MYIISALFSTTTLKLFDIVPSAVETMIIAIPSETPVIIPSLTVAMLVSELDQMSEVTVAFSGTVVAFTVLFSPALT